MVIQTAIEGEEILLIPQTSRALRCCILYAFQMLLSYIANKLLFLFGRTPTIQHARPSVSVFVLGTYDHNRQVSEINSIELAISSALM